MRRVWEDLTQGTEEWLEARRGIVTASVVGRLITPSTLRVAHNDTARGLILTLLGERLTGRVEPVYVSDDMLRGTMEEPLARAAYEEWAGVSVAQVGFITEDRWGPTIGYSPDGLVGEDGLIEIKSRRPKKHIQTILADRVPIENMAQIQCGLMVSGRQWCDYVSYCAGMPLYVKRVHPDSAWRSVIVQAAIDAECAMDDYTTAYQAVTNGMPVMPESTFDQEIVI